MLLGTINFKDLDKYRNKLIKEINRLVELFYKKREDYNINFAILPKEIELLDKPKRRENEIILGDTVILYGSINTSSIIIDTNQFVLENEVIYCSVKQDDSRYTESIKLPIKISELERFIIITLNLEK